MKTKILLFNIVLCVSYSTAWTQTTYGTNAGSMDPGIGSSNSYFGYEAGFNNIANDNTFIGHQSGSSNTIGINNTFLGVESGQNNNSGYSNTFLGSLSGSNNIDGDLNIYIGSQSGLNNQNGNSNTFIGSESGYLNNGNNNTFIGHSSGSNNIFGSGNVFLGHYAGHNETGSELLYIDNSSTPSPLIWGDFAANLLNFNGNVGIGTPSATAALHIRSYEYDFTPDIDGTQIRTGIIELTRNNLTPQIDFQNDINGTDFDARIQLTADDELSIQGAGLNVDGSLRIDDITQDDALTHVLVEDADGNIYWRDATSLGGGADDQQLNLNGNSLELEDGGSVDLSVYLDDTDTQLSEVEVDNFVDNNGYLTVEVDGSTTNELLTAATLNGTNLELTDAGGTTIVDLSSLSGGGSQNLLSVLGQGNNAGGNNLTNVGSIGIGTATPDAAAALDVNGAVKIGDVDINTPGDYNLYVEAGILTEKVKVAVKTESEWSDHVFETDYELKPLEKVEAFVTKNKHLPGIPSASAVVKEGIDLAQMDARLLEKIEELTLYTIEQDKTLKQQKKLIQLLQQQNEQLIKRMENLENK